TDVKTGKLLRYLINTLDQCRSGEMHPVAEDAPLRVVTGLDELKRLSGRQDFIPTGLETAKIRVHREARATVLSDQFGNCGSSIADNDRENLFGDGKDAPSVVMRKAIVKNADFEWTGSILLSNQRGRCSPQIVLSLLASVDELHSHAALTNIRFED